MLGNASGCFGKSLGASLKQIRQHRTRRPFGRFPCPSTPSIDAPFYPRPPRSPPPPFCRARRWRRSPPPASLPARGEFVVRGAHVLSMDDKVGDLAARRRARARRRHRRGGGERGGAGRAGHRRQGHDLHARLRRHPLAPLDQLPAPADARRRSEEDLFPGHLRRSACITRRRTAIAAYGSASPRRSAPASPPRTTGRTTCAARRTPTPRCGRCATAACAAFSPTARRSACPTTR